MVTVKPFNANRHRNKIAPPSAPAAINTLHTSHILCHTTEYLYTVVIVCSMYCKCGRYVWNWSYVVEYCTFIAKAKSNGDDRSCGNIVANYSIRCNRQRVSLSLAVAAVKAATADATANMATLVIVIIERTRKLCALHCRCTAKQAHTHTH